MHSYNNLHAITIIVVAFHLTLKINIYKDMKNIITRFMAIYAVIAINSQAQILIGLGEYLETFDSMGTSSSAQIPTNWKISPAGDSTPQWDDQNNFTAVNRAASSGSPTAGGRYNWGDGTSDRALGFMTSSSYSSPNSIMVWLQNSSEFKLNHLTVSYDIERYRINSSAASVTFAYSYDGQNWTQYSDATITFDSGTSTYFFPPQVQSKNFTLNNLDLAQNGDFYLCWTFDTVGANSQGLGLDNVRLSAVPEPREWLFSISLGLIGFATARRFLFKHNA